MKDQKLIYLGKNCPLGHEVKVKSVELVESECETESRQLGTHMCQYSKQVLSLFQVSGSPWAWILSSHLPTFLLKEGRPINCFIAGVLIALFHNRGAVNMKFSFSFFILPFGTRALFENVEKFIGPSSPLITCLWTDIIHVL